MAIPSGSGTEVLKRATIDGNNGAWTPLLTGAANHIYTILSVIAYEAGGNAETIFMRVGNIYLLQDTLPVAGTYVWNDKFIMSGAENLEIYNSAGNVDWYCSYIDQDWS